MKSVVVGVAVMIGGFVVGCSQDPPTAPTRPWTEPAHPTDTGGIDAATVERRMAELNAMFHEMSRMGDVRALAVDEDFNCTNVEEVRARFSEPGFVDGLSVGFFLKFVGIPTGNKTLRVWWDYDNAFDEYQDIFIGDGDVNPENAGLFDIETVVEHAYTSAGTKLVRVELILDGETGNCARNREVFVTPDTSFDHVVTFAGVPNCIVGFGRTMGLRANFTPPIPAGTTYTVRFRVTGVGVGFGSFTIATVGNTMGPDMAAPPLAPQFTPPPNDFTATLNASVDHRQLQIVSTIFVAPPPTSMTTQITGISIPGKTVQLVGSLAGSCP